MGLEAILFVVLLTAKISALRASTSSGMNPVYQGPPNGLGPHVYISNNIDLEEKNHVIISLPRCECAAIADVQKIYQSDYLLSLGHMYSCAFYVNSGQIYNRRKCNLTAEEFSKRTDLHVNSLGSISPVEPEPGENHLSIERLFWDNRIEGLVLERGMRDFYGNAYVVANHKDIFSVDKSGGFLFIQGNVEIRPCHLFPWPEPWIYSEFSTRHLVNTSEGDSRLIYYTPEMAKHFNKIVKTMKAEGGVIKQKHLDNLLDNTGSDHMVYMFSFEALFIPHRVAEEFLVMLDYFSKTDLCAYVYVPFIFQLLFDQNEWKYMNYRMNNETIRMGQSLLDDCLGETVEDMHINKEAASSLYWFAYGECGGGIFVEIEQIIRRIEIYSDKPVYVILFYLLLSVVIICFLLKYRRELCRCMGVCFARLKRRRQAHEYIKQMDDITLDRRSEVSYPLTKNNLSGGRDSRSGGSDDEDKEEEGEETKI